MRTHRKAAPAAVLLLALMTTAVAAAADQQTVAVKWHAQSGLSGPVAHDATATLVRRANGVSFQLRTENLRPGHAYTVWFVAVNNPSACAVFPCTGPEIIQKAATNSQVTYGAGHVVGGSGQATFAGAFQAGPLTDGWLAGRGLDNPLGAEIHLVLNDHGPVIQGLVSEMIHTYRAGCTDVSLPGIFPASAKADGTPGPNTCQLYQVAIFGGS